MLVYRLDLSFSVYGNLECICGFGFIDWIYLSQYVVSQGANVDVSLQTGFILLSVCLVRAPLWKWVYRLDLSFSVYGNLECNCGCGFVDWIYLAQYMVSQGATVVVGCGLDLCASVYGNLG